MPKITLYQFPKLGGEYQDFSMSPFCVKVALALQYKGLSYEVENMVSAKKVNPRGLLPALRYDGQMVCDSSEIIRFLDVHHPKPGLLPSDSADRARVEIFEDWADEYLFWLAVHKRWADPAGFALTRKVLFLNAPVPAIARWLAPFLVRRSMLKYLSGQGLGKLGPSEAAVERRKRFQDLDALLLQNEYLVGEQPSTADLAVFAMLHAFRRFRYPDVEAEIAAVPALAAYYERMGQICKIPYH